MPTAAGHTGSASSTCSCHTLPGCVLPCSRGRCGLTAGRVRPPAGRAAAPVRRAQPPFCRAGGQAPGWCGGGSTGAQQRCPWVTRSPWPGWPGKTTKSTKRVIVIFFCCLLHPSIACVGQGDLCGFVFRACLPRLHPWVSQCACGAMGCWSVLYPELCVGCVQGPALGLGGMRGSDDWRGSLTSAIASRLSPHAANVLGYNTPK